MTAENNHSSRLEINAAYAVSAPAVGEYLEPSAKCECTGANCMVTDHGPAQFVVRRNGVMLSVCERCDLSTDQKLYEVGS